MEGLTHAEAIGIFKSIKTGDLVLNVLRRNRQLLKKYVSLISTLIALIFLMSSNFSTFSLSPVLPTQNLAQIWRYLKPTHKQSTIFTCFIYHLSPHFNPILPHRRFCDLFLINHFLIFVTF